MKPQNFIVTEFYDVQLTFYVQAKNEDEAKKKVYSGNLKADKENWETNGEPTEVEKE